jgi:hypothetical protein
VINVTNLARVSLGLIRLTNGAIAVVAPQLITRRFMSGDPPPVAVYALRMFGIRTVLVGFDLLRTPGRERTHAARVAPIIHGSDLLSAIFVATSGRAPKEISRFIVVISGINMMLALLMLLKR